MPVARMTELSEKHSLHSDNTAVSDARTHAMHTGWLQHIHVCLRCAAMAWLVTALER